MVAGGQRLRMGLTKEGEARFDGRAPEAHEAAEDHEDLRANHRAVEALAKALGQRAEGVALGVSSHRHMGQPEQDVPGCRMSGVTGRERGPHDPHADQDEHVRVKEVGGRRDAVEDRQLLAPKRIVRLSQDLDLVDLLPPDRGPDAQILHE